MRRVDHYHEQDFMNSMCGYIESYEFYNEGIVEKLESKIKEYTGAKYALCVNSATNAIFMCLYYYKKIRSEIRGIDRNEVIIPNYGHPAAFRACKFLDLIPIPVDLEMETLSIKPDDVIKEFSPWTLAYINIETNGIVGHAEELKGLNPNVLYIEDSSPSILQLYNGKRAGLFGDVGIYSFSPTKPMCCGEGGVIVTNEDYLYEGLKNIRYSSYESDSASLNFNMSPFLAAYLIPQFDSIYSRMFESVRENIHKDYSKNLKIFSQKGVTNRYGSIMYLSNKAKEISEELSRHKIEHRYNHYPLLRDNESLPISKEIKQKIIELPISHRLKYTDILRVCEIVNEVEHE
jgi:dTDP-4-amino-4,6-dideoxygalactose transaminase